MSLEEIKKTRAKKAIDKRVGRRTTWRRFNCRVCGAFTEMAARKFTKQKRKLVCARQECREAYRRIMGLDRRRRFDGETIFCALQRGEQGEGVMLICGDLGIDDKTYRRWKSRFSGLSPLQINAAQEQAKIDGYAKGWVTQTTRGGRTTRVRPGKVDWKVYEYICKQCGKKTQVTAKEVSYVVPTYCSQACYRATLPAKARRHLTPANAEERAEWQARTLEAIHNSPLTGRFETHHCAKEYSLLSPEGEVFRFCNMSKFVRDHEHLFDPDDLVWNDMMNCRAAQGLRRLDPSRNNHKDSWKGWTWCDEGSRP